MIDNKYYEIKSDDVRRFAQATGIRHREAGGQFEFVYCPYCHGGKSKDKNTFAINSTTGQFECKRSSCGARGNIVTLAKDFSDIFQIDKEFNTYYNINNYRDSFKKFKDAHRVFESKDPAIEFMKNRGISEAVTRKYELTTMDYFGKECIVFPFKDENGEMTFYKVRKLDGTEFDGKGKERTAQGNCKKILFGMNQCEDFGTLVITEGQIDSLSLAEAGIKNAVSVPLGKNVFNWRPNVWDWMVRFDEIVVFGDREGTEITLAKEISGFFPKRVRVVQLADYHGYKDANDILLNVGKEALVNAVNNAKPVVSFRIKNLAEVEPVDLSKIPCYPTKVKQLDEAIGGGFHKGELNVLTGKCGEGKSTFAGQVVARMIQSGLKCFCYSGELPESMFRAWIDYQIGGSTRLSEARRNAIANWYNEKCYVYDNSAVIDEEENLFDLITQAIRDLKCEFILIDNLMTAMEDKADMDLFRQQSNFIKRLTKIAKGFEVIILLIAHPRKGNDNSNDSISGSGDITNRANVVLRYQRDKNNSNQSVLMITKNRTTGKLLTDDNGIKVKYDEQSMRVYENDIRDFEEFMVDTEPINDFVEVEDYDNIPFD